ncbi:MAG: adenylate/guanylate cyclase domain-containing protein, partial [Acidiferrobacterales bacterium]
MQRKLAAIFYADVAGYSRLTGQDEEGTHRTLSAYLDAMTGGIKQHQGEVLHIAGDAVLADFNSVIDALTCAVEIQRELNNRNDDLPDDRRMQFRIGINLGDVIVDRNEIYGDGVNVAARLETLAEPGGACISGSVYDAVGTKLRLNYEYMGEQSVKNIDRPVRAYRVVLVPEEQVEERETDKKAAAEKAFTLENPSIAVLPFANMSADPEQEFFADGITEDLITALSRLSGLFVIARNSVFTYKEKAVDVKQVSRDLNVRYVLEGSVRKAGNRVRITAQLIEAGTGHHLWAERYDRDLTDVFAVQDEISTQVVTALQVQLVEGEQARVWRRSTNNLEAWQCLTEGLAHFRRFTLEENSKARQLFHKAVNIDPEYAAARVWLGWTYWAEVRYLWAESPDDALVQAVEMAHEALALDDTVPETRGLLGTIHLIKKEYDQAIAEGEKAIALDPNGADVTALLAMTLNWAGRPDEAVGLIRKAMGLSPLFSAWYLSVLAHAQRLLEQYEEAIETYKASIERSPRTIGAHIGLTEAYAESDRQEEA